MSDITHCPSCQTQFIVTEIQLNQHDGLVRCGHCLHVFNAKNQSVNLSTENTAALADLEQTQTAKLELSSQADHGHDLPSLTSQEHYFNNIQKPAKINIARYSRFILVILALSIIVQSVYFLRSTIAVYYPNTKSTLVKVCHILGCSIELPKKIDLIVIDDSDMQEDDTYLGVIHLSSTLINRANFAQAYPNIEVTLTDIDDKPKLRRIFKPTDYLANQAETLKGMAAGQEVKMKLVISAEGLSAAGYRLFLSY